MRHLIYICSLLTFASAFAEAPKIDDYQRANPNDPRPTGNSVGSPANAKTLPGDLKEMNSPEQREDYVSSVQKALVTWDQRIEALDKKESSKKAAAVLRTMRQRTNADIAELGRVTGKAWLDVKARIESRFRRMEKEYRAMQS